MREVVIASAARTPIGCFNGALSSLSAPRLGAVAIKAAVERAGIPADQIDEVLMGCVLQAGLGQAPARQAMRYAGIPDSVNTCTQRSCRASPLPSRSRSWWPGGACPSTRRRALRP